MLDSLNSYSEFRYAEPSFACTLFTTHPNDPYYAGTSPATFAYQWALHNTGQSPPSGTTDADIDAPEAWDYETGDSDVLVAILDTGIPYNDVTQTLLHNDLNDANKFIIGPVFAIDDRMDPVTTMHDVLGHGTHIAGILGAETNNSYGIAGVAWGCKILVIKTYHTYPQSDDMARGIIAAVDSSADVITICSGAGSAWNSTLEVAIDYAYDNDVLVVCAAGNQGGVTYPAKFYYANNPDSSQTGFSNVVSVGATTKNDAIASFSSYDAGENHIRVSAPGGQNMDGDYSTRDTSDIYSTLYPGQFIPQTNTYYGFCSGTSMASPHVAGLAGLIRSRFPSLTAQEVAVVLEKSADDIESAGVDPKSGYGRINAHTALAPPAAPANLSLTGSQGQHPQLDWDANDEPDLDRYNIYKKEGAGNWFLTGYVNSTTTTWTDGSVEIGDKFDPFVYYKINASDYTEQKSPYSWTVSTRLGSTSKEIAESDPESNNLPTTYDLSEVYPNPFNPSTTIRYQLPKSTIVNINIYDISGRVIWSRDNSLEPAGYYSIVWSGETSTGAQTQSGVYLIEFTTPKFRSVKKAVYIR